MNRNRIAQLAPGIALCAAIALAAMGLQRLEEHWTGRPWLEALVIAILLGTATANPLDARTRAGFPASASRPKPCSRSP